MKKPFLQNVRDFGYLIILQIKASRHTSHNYVLSREYKKRTKLRLRSFPLNINVSQQFPHGIELPYAKIEM